MAHDRKSPVTALEVGPNVEMHAIRRHQTKFLRGVRRVRPGKSSGWVLGSAPRQMAGSWPSFSRARIALLAIASLCALKQIPALAKLLSIAFDIAIERSRTASQTAGSA